MPDEDVLDYCIPHLQRMFPIFGREWVLGPQRIEVTVAAAIPRFGRETLVTTR